MVSAGIFLHYAPAGLAEAIAREGLRTGMPEGLSAETPWAKAAYGLNPVYLGRPGCDFLDAILYVAGRVERRALQGFRVDVAGLALVADLASLVDAGGRLSGGRLAWARARRPAGLAPYLDRRGGVALARLLDPGDPASAAAIALTGTCACLEDIPPVRLSPIVHPADQRCDATDPEVVHA